MYKKLLLLLTVFGLLFSFTSCVLFDKNENTTGSNNQVVIDGADTVSVNNVAKMSASDLCVVNESKQPTLKKSFKDNDYYYYFFDLGSISNVPLEGFSNMFAFKNMGQKVTYGFQSTEVEENTVSSTVSTTVENTVSTTCTHSLTVGVEGGKKDVFKISAETAFSHVKGRSETNTFEKSYTNASSYSKSTTKAINMEFDKNSANGFYGYILTGAIDVYAIVLWDIVEQEYFVEYYSYITTCWTDFYYFETATEFVNYEYETIDFQIPSDLPVPSTLYDEIRPLTPVTSMINTTPLSCALDNKYNYSSPDVNCNNNHYSHNFEFGKFVVSGGLLDSGNVFKQCAGSSINIAFRLEYDADALPTQDNMTARSVSNDSKQSGFYNLPWNVGERTVGRGMIVALVEYEDMSPSSRICLTDVFNGKKGGSTVTIISGITKPCTIKIAICYELEMWAPGFLSIVDNYWMNWRINQSIVVE